MVLSVVFWQKPVRYGTGFAAISYELLRVETNLVETQYRCENTLPAKLEACSHITADLCLNNKLSL